MTLKKEYALLGIAILALGLYLFLNKQDQVHYTLPETPRLETTEVTKIEIGKAGGTVTLTRQDDQWRLVPGDYPADTAQVERMLKSIAELTITALISETQSFARYDLDADRKIEVRAYNGDRLVRQFAVGKAASTFRHTHVLLGDDKNVYHAAGSFRWEFDKPIDDLRDKTVLTIDRNAITAIEILADDKVLAIEKSAPPPEEAKPDQAAAPDDQTSSPPAANWVTAEGETVDTADVDQLLAALTPLKCKAFLADDQKAALADPRYRLQLKGPDTQTLEIFAPLTDSETDFTATSSGTPYPFTLAEFDVTKIKDFFNAVTGVEDEPEVPAPPQ